jgi:hypothetical protein
MPQTSLGIMFVSIVQNVRWFLHHENSWLGAKEVSALSQRGCSILMYAGSDSDYELQHAVNQVGSLRIRARLW